MPFAHVDAGLPCALEQDVVELGARDLIRLRPDHTGGGGEIDAAAAGPVVRDEPRAPLFREAGRGHRSGHAEEGEGVVGRGQQRLADVKARERLPLEEDNRTPTLRQRDRRRSPAGPPPPPQNRNVPSTAGIVSVPSRWRASHRKRQIALATFSACAPCSDRSGRRATADD